VLTGFGLLAGCGVLPPQGQPTTRVLRIGHLARQDWPPARRQGFQQGLLDRGYVEGENIVVEWRWAERTEQLDELAAELVGLRVDLIVAASTLAIQAAMRATDRIPIVMAASGDPVGIGLVTSLGRPGGNVTGLSTLAVGLSAKRVEIFKETIPGMSRLGILWDPASLDKEKDLRESESAAQRLGVLPFALEIGDARDIERLSDAIARERLDAIMTLMDSHPVQVAETAGQAGVPSMCEARGFTMVGGLMSYGPNPFIWYGRAVEFIDKIAKGAKPADLPVEQPTDVELVINMQTARALGLSIPPSILAQAAELLQ